jgi:dTDP-4-dehydrorhamnose reductase
LTTAQPDAAPGGPVLVTGGGGVLGGALIRTAPPGALVSATRRARPVAGCPAYDVELSDPAAVRALFADLRPGLVIHTAYSAREPERDILAATRAVADAAAEVGAELVHLSTDALFDGESSPYLEDDAPAPVHDYGRWKARAEEYVRERSPEAAIVRTSLIVSLQPPDAATAWVQRGLRAEERVTLFTDEIRCPIEVGDLARQIWEIGGLPAGGRRGVWHLAGPEALSRYALGLLLAAHHGLPAERLVPALSRTSPAPRPRDLRLLTTRADARLRTRAWPISRHLAPPALAGAPHDA